MGNMPASDEFRGVEDVMDERVTLSLLQAARAYRVRSARLLSRIGLYPGQDALLKLLQDGPITMGEAAALLSIQPPTVTKMVNRLSAAGLVRTEVLDRDRRKVAVSMTDAARERVEEIDAIWRELEKEALEDLQPGPIREGLAAIARNLSKQNGKSGEST
jgi:DNA-binding MarR family transcriptional regulator